MEMEEYEVDLRDYLRVMWRKKWLILSVFLIAILAAGLLSFTAPSQYETQALLRLNPLPQITNFQLQMPSLQAARLILKAPDLLLRTVQEAQLGSESAFQGMTPQQIASWLEDHLKSKISDKTELLEIKLNGTLAPEMLQRILQTHLNVFQQYLQDDLTRQIQRGIARIKTEEEIIAAQQNMLARELATQIAQRKKVLEQQRAAVQRQIAAITQDKEKLHLQAGEQNATLEGVILREKFLALSAQLQQIEAELATLEREGRKEFPKLDARIWELEDQLRTLVISREKGEKLLDIGWKPVEVISQPRIPIAPIGPNRKMNIAVAGVLGLFVGVLLAFFIHYLEGGEPETKAKAEAGIEVEPKAKAEGEGQGRGRGG